MGQIHIFEVPSPCRGVCENLPNQDACRGCFRTREERRNWNTFSDDMKVKILNETVKRRKAWRMKQRMKNGKLAEEELEGMEDGVIVIKSFEDETKNVTAKQLDLFGEEELVEIESDGEVEEAPESQKDAPEDLGDMDELREALYGKDHGSLRKSTFPANDGSSRPNEIAALAMPPSQDNGMDPSNSGSSTSPTMGSLFDDGSAIKEGKPYGRVDAHLAQDVEERELSDILPPIHVDPDKHLAQTRKFHEERKAMARLRAKSGNIVTGHQEEIFEDSAANKNAFMKARIGKRDLAGTGPKDRVEVVGDISQDELVKELSRETGIDPRDVESFKPKRLERPWAENPAPTLEKPVDETSTPAFMTAKRQQKDARGANRQEGPEESTKPRSWMEKVQEDDTVRAVREMRESMNGGERR